MRLLAVAILVIVAASGIPALPLPAIGPLLDPLRGVWGTALDAELPRRAEASIRGLEAPVYVAYDTRGVPHIFAHSRADAYRALGYVVARDRLFQLELQTRAANGTLSELLGPRAVPLDRETRALGLPRAAEVKLAAVDRASDGWRFTTAYAEGVNAYIDGMRARDVPIEYRLLGARPARWAPVNTIHLLNRMGLTLAYDTEELRRLRVAALVGDRAADALLPVNSPIQEPIEPNGQHAARLDARALPPPGAPDSLAGVAARDLAPALGTLARLGGPRDAVGSNNWAVSPRRTRDGFALLAGDPHLDLTLPSIWYEVHLVVPDTLDVYGVTIPGAPGIVIGFNRDVAWTFTNGQNDVLDFYAESVDVAANPTRYLVDGRWRPITQRVERYAGPHGTTLRTDTVRYTHRGPMLRANGRWLSMRWLVLDSTTVTQALEHVAGARSVDEWLDTMRTWDAPAQNMLVADRHGTIAIRTTGRFPIRPGDGRGDIIRDGTTSRSDWIGFWPLAKHPFARDPAQGFLASANQQPIDPRVDSSYLGADWIAPWRAMRINTLLRADSQVTVDDMRRFQTDPGSARADLFVPRFLDAAARALARTPGDSALRRAAALLGGWDRRYTEDDERAVLFELAMRELRARLWDELVPPGETDPVALPQESVTAELLDQPTSAWWDDRRTPGTVEMRDDVLAASLRAALRDAVRRYGPPDGGGWTWRRIRHDDIWHLLRIPAFSRLELPVQGGPGTLNPSSGSGTQGPSWRMVVQLGAEVRAWGIFPGGESGNPASSRYDSELPRWLAGRLDSLIVPRDSAALAGTAVRATLTLAPGR